MSSRVEQRVTVGRMHPASRTWNRSAVDYIKHSSFSYWPLSVTIMSLQTVRCLSDITDRLAYVRY